VALARDASTPPWAVVASGTALTTAAFTPPVGAALVDLSLFDTATTTRTEVTTTATGSTSAWTKVAHQNTGGGAVDINWAKVLSSVSTTVTTTWPAANDIALDVEVFTGADPTNPIGQTGLVAATATTTISVTPTLVGSIVLIGYCDFNLSGIPTGSANLILSGSDNTSSNKLTWHSAPLVSGVNDFVLSGCFAGSGIAWAEVIPAPSATVTMMKNPRPNRARFRASLW
jgi:hypothetical protein